MACRVSALKVYTSNVSRDKIIVDLDISYAGDAEFHVSVAGFRGGLNELVLNGKMRVVLEPLIPRPPMVAAISGSFLELPAFDFNLTGMGQFAQLPLLADAIRSVINTQLANLCVLPNSIVMPLVPNDVNLTRVYAPLPEGVLRIKLVEARNLENKDRSMVLRADKSDPYVELQVGSQLFKTRTINNDLNPQFNEYFEATVDQASAQRLRVNLFDEDTTSADEELGHLAIPLQYVQKSKVVNKVFNLEGCEHGEVRLRLYWCELSSEMPSVEAQRAYSGEWSSANRPVHKSLLLVFVDSVKDLPYPKSNVEPSPVLELTVANATQRTPVQTRTTSPVYLSKFLFLLESLENELDSLTIKAIDSNTNKPLGELSLQLSEIRRLENMETFDSVYQLRQGAHSASITLTIRIRHIVPSHEDSSSSGSSSPLGDMEHYANDSYIDRASPKRASSKHAAPPAKHNGSALAPEAGKVPENDKKHYPESETQLKTSRFRTLERRPSSSSSTVSHSRTLVDRLLRRRKEAPNDANNGRAAGALHVSIEYNQSSYVLAVEIHRARDVIPASSSDSPLKPYVSVKLIDAKDAVKAHKRTRVADNSTAPVFDSRFEFVVDPADLDTNILRLALNHRSSYALLSTTTKLGSLEFPLAELKKNASIHEQWLELDA